MTHDALRERVLQRDGERRLRYAISRSSAAARARPISISSRRSIRPRLYAITLIRISYTSVELEFIPDVLT